ncbi:MAG: S-adenosyl-L-methionine-dependent methyltransferase [Monoraphidium minutum]|nr:MAG: S-adenosyl-L-methionine-dependent methyltransferase [Monoraphidium minutum]
MTRDFPDASFDVIYTRDMMLHVATKEAMLARLLGWLKPGGKLLITDYARSDAEPSPAFAAYIAQRGYDLRPVAAYGRVLEDAGFADVKAEDRTDQFIACLDAELGRVEAGKAAFVARFGAAGHAAVVDGWKDKLERARAGEQRWALLMGSKPRQ